MMRGKIIRNKPIEAENNFYQTDYQSLRRVLPPLPR